VVVWGIEQAHKNKTQSSGWYQSRQVFAGKDKGMGRQSADSIGKTDGNSSLPGVDIQIAVALIASSNQSK